MVRADLSPTVPVELVQAALDGPELGDLDALAVVAEARRRVDLLFDGILLGDHRRTQRRIHGLVKVQRKRRFGRELDAVPRVRQGEQLVGGTWYAEPWAEASARCLSCTVLVSGAFFDALPAGSTKMTRDTFRSALLLRLRLFEVLGEGRCPFPGPCTYYGQFHAGHGIVCLNGQQNVVHRSVLRRLEKELKAVNIRRQTGSMSMSPVRHFFSATRKLSGRRRSRLFWRRKLSAG